MSTTWTITCTQPGCRFEMDDIRQGPHAIELLTFHAQLHPGHVSTCRVTGDLAAPVRVGPTYRCPSCGEPYWSPKTCAGRDAIWGRIAHTPMTVQPVNQERGR